MTGSPSPPAFRPLLDRIVDDALDPAYAEAASHPRPPATRSRLATVAVVLVAGLAVGVTVSQDRAAAPSTEQTRTALLGDARTREANVAELGTQIEALRAETARLQASALTSSTAGRAAAQQRADLIVTAGETPVAGPGVAVEVDDAPDAATNQRSAERRPDGTALTGRVRDRDLQDVVNALWAAGAEAVSVGGIRLSPTTAIRTAGETILAGYRPLVAPYVVLAIGDPDQLPDRFRAAAVDVLARLRDQASPVRVTGRTTISLPAGAGVDPRSAVPGATSPSPSGARS
jgi:uncharacterized protein YlxW (UPF0749 family)